MHSVINATALQGKAWRYFAGSPQIMLCAIWSRVWGTYDGYQLLQDLVSLSPSCLFWSVFDSPFSRSARTFSVRFTSMTPKIISVSLPSKHAPDLIKRWCWWWSGSQIIKFWVFCQKQRRIIPRSWETSGDCSGREPVRANDWTCRSMPMTSVNNLDSHGVRWFEASWSCLTMTNTTRLTTLSLWFVWLAVKVTGPLNQTIIYSAFPSSQFPSHCPVVFPFPLLPPTPPPVLPLPSSILPHIKRG